MVLAVQLTPWHLLLLPAFGMGIVLLTYLAHRLAPPRLPPEYILNMSKEHLMAGQDIRSAEIAVATLVDEGFEDEVKEPQPPIVHQGELPIFRESVNNEVMDEYNKYKRLAGISGGKIKGLTAWLRGFDPDLARRLNDE